MSNQDATRDFVPLFDLSVGQKPEGVIKTS